MPAAAALAFSLQHRCLQTARPLWKDVIIAVPSMVRPHVLKKKQRNSALRAHCTERQRHKRSPASCPSVRHSKTRSVSAKRQQKYNTGFKTCSPPFRLVCTAALRAACGLQGDSITEGTIATIDKQPGAAPQDFAPT